MKKILFLSFKAQIKSEKDNFSYLNYFFSREKFTDKYFLPRVPFNLGQATVYSRFKKNNFSSTPRKKKDFFAEHNFVFLSKNENMKFLARRGSGKHLIKCENFKIKNAATKCKN